MALFKCKMCGGELEIVSGKTVATCEYCGTKQTLPNLDDDRRANLYDRANHFRRSNEFDKAMGIYEQILNEDNTDAEAYWSLVLCNYGIEYVEDPASHKRLPTVNRAQFTSIFDDDNYKSALQYADGYQKVVYEEEAAAINEIQKSILAISEKEDPFDVFICYKETDNYGRRTPDSVLATELYNELTRDGYKVFFARITLEDKLGSAYEPYIFAALNSAKVMVVLGTKSEYFNAVWVKNEWSRYLSLIGKGQKKVLIPAYKDMDPYDMPEAFSHLQAQDMSKLGFMQDLTRGIKKIVDAHGPRPSGAGVLSDSDSNVETLLKRAFMFLEDGVWSFGNEYCEKALEIDPKNALAYVGKLMAELHIKRQEALKDYDSPLDEKETFKKAVELADEVLKATLLSYNENIKGKIERANKAAKKRALRNKLIAIITPTVCVCIAFAIVLVTVIIPNSKYDKAMELLKSEKYSEAALIFEELGKHKDSQSKLAEINDKYNKAVAYLSANRLIEAHRAFVELGDYKDSVQQAEVSRVLLLQINIQNLKRGDYILLGTYEQNGDISNGKEGIEWKVLDIEDGSALLISDRILDCQPYHTSNTKVSWEDSSLRKWLNNEFFDSAFSSIEQSVILNNDANFRNNMFVLSDSESGDYLLDSNMRRCEATKYAIEKGMSVNSSNGAAWWLRDADASSKVPYVTGKGGLFTDGENPTKSMGVRPAMWIDLQSLASTVQ